MISGTLFQTGKMMEMTMKWEEKKQTGNILKKEDKQLSQEELQMELFKEQLKSQKESNKYSSVYTKMQKGEELTLAEEEILRERSPQTYIKYKADQMEKKVYEEKLRNCKTKEEAAKLHVNYMNAKLSELKSVDSNSNISKGAKLAAAQRILGATNRITAVYQAFTQSAEYSTLPTEEELTEANKQQVHEVLIKPETDGIVKETVTETMHEQKQSYPSDDILKTEKEIFWEMLQIEEKYSGEHKKEKRIDIIV